MDVLIWLVVGGMIGWLASMLLQTEGTKGVLLSVVLGLVGAVVAGLLITPFLGGDNANQSNLGLQALVVPLIGAVVLLAGGYLFRRGILR